MITLPFIYFSLLLTYILYKKRAFDISAYLVLLYLLSSFFSILIDIKHLRSFDTKNYEISLFPALLYCCLLTLTIWPFYRFSSEKIKLIKLNRSKLFDRVVYFYFAIFLLILITSVNSLIQILHGNIAELRNALGNGSGIANNSIASNPIYMFAGILAGFSTIMLLFYFYSICFLQRSKWFNFITLLSSMSIILLGMVNVDRSKTAYWIITYGLMIVLFWRKMSRKQHKNAFFISIMVLSALIFYFLNVTFSRFNTQDLGSGNSMISYAGQSYINFCYFFDNVSYNQFSLQRIFPLFYKLFIHNGIRNSVSLNAAISLRTGKSIGVFSTFLGDIMVASGRIAVIIYCFFFYIVAKVFCQHKNKSSVHFYKIILMFCAILVPMCGIFTYFYADFTVIIALIFFILYALYLKRTLLKQPSYNKRRPYNRKVLSLADYRDESAFH